MTGKTAVAAGVKKGAAREYAEAFLTAFAYAVIILTFLIRPFKIPSGSMQPTLQIGDRILVNRFLYKLSEIERGDIGVFIYPIEPEKDFIKRVVGLAGDTVEIRAGRVLVNGERLGGPHFGGRRYLRAGEEEYCGPLRVPEGSFYVLGDNSANSADSRFWGFVPVGNMKGKAFMVYWPPRRLRKLK